MSQYEPKTIPLFENQDMQNLISYVYRELQSISKAFDGVQAVQLTETFVAPKRYQKGTICFADGVHWNPGSGKGFYAYDGTSWHFLG